VISVAVTQPWPPALEAAAVKCPMCLQKPSLSHLHGSSWPLAFPALLLEVTLSALELWRSLCKTLLQVVGHPRLFQYQS
jgi:hypothetical protein